jgi:RimJ/RimL family protein N-acetyltransferase
MPISIRPFKSTDASALQGAVSSSVGHIGPWLDWCTPRYTLKDARAWVNSSIDHWQQGQAFRWAIVGSNDKHILGGVDIYLPVLGQPVGQMGYWVRRDSVGRGICTQAAAQALHWSFDRLGLARVELFVQPDNAASIAVALKLGAKLQGQQEDQIVFKGKKLPASHYTIQPENFDHVQLQMAELDQALTIGSKPSEKHQASSFEFRRQQKKPRA